MKERKNRSGTINKRRKKRARKEWRKEYEREESNGEVRVRKKEIIENEKRNGRRGVKE